MLASPGPTNPLVSVVIVNYNGMHVLEECLHSVFAQPYRPIEVIVVDNGSSDASVDLIREKFPEVLLVLVKENLGFAGGNNRGVARAKGEYIVLLNNDTRVEAGWLPALFEMIKGPDVAVVTSKVVTEGVPSEFYEMNGTINYLGYNIMREFSDLSQVFFAGGASVMFRRDEIGQPFLDEYFLYQEDVYLSWKLRLLGKSVAMDQQSLVHHKGSVTAKRQSSAMVTFYQERNRMLNALLLYESRTLMLLAPYFIADAFMKLVLSLFTHRKSPLGIVRSYWWIVTHPAWITRERTTIQSARAVSDKAVLRMMSYKVVDGESLAARSLNGISKVYARIVGLDYHG